MLPPFPQIFHGRESELRDLVASLLAVPARVAILGPGGMGKTVLAAAALYDSKLADKYPSRHFISCDSAYTSDSLVVAIASNLGLGRSAQSARPVIHHLSTGAPCLMVLDNFETPWEPLDGRGKVEEFLSLLTDIPHVALLITMRGAERPGKVQWTRPFLHPLSPLTPLAAHQTFIDIADKDHDDSDIDRLLDLTDNIPLAVQLVAAIAAIEGCHATLERWELERTNMLSAGSDKRSNLELSIMLSLSSPRMLSSPHAADLLSLLSLLSDGISDIDLMHCTLSIPDISKCKTTLLRISLAYIDHAGRLKVLAPIREYIHAFRPPSSPLVRPLQKHYNDLLRLWKTVMVGSSSLVGDLTPRLISNRGNLYNLLLHALESDTENPGETIQSILLLNRLNLQMKQGLSPLLRHVPAVLAGIQDPKLHGEFAIEAFLSSNFYALPNVEKSFEEGIQNFGAIKDVEGEARLYNAAASYYLQALGDDKKAQSLFGRALSLVSHNNHSDAVQLFALRGLAVLEHLHGNFSEGLELARRSHRIAVAMGDIMGEVNGIRCQAMCYKGLGDFKHSMKLLGKGRQLVLRAGMQGAEVEAMLMSLEAHIYQLKTEYAEARQVHEEIMHQASPVLSPLDYAYAVLNIAWLDIVTGASVEIVSGKIDVAVSALGNAKDWRGMLECDVCRADLQLREGNTLGACDEYIRLFSRWRMDDELACRCLVQLADPTHRMHPDSDIMPWAIVFLVFTMRSSCSNVLMAHQALRCLGEVLAQEHLDDDALSILTVALEGFTWMDVHQSRAECMRTMGDVYLRRGEFSTAPKLWKDARPLFERSLQAKAVAEIDRRLGELEHEP
ncbi:NB-ARC domain-containing protein [Mycena sanguinolenta]|uniref:NB-ARC domain-containing protein n=1 Tax=Mycena sanguinolenta TaxID=230812 RepID=A0A8H7DF10_9AGAR|nr:NB-ARC domain-containing protein [Mycena sanguinolenta]